MYMYLSVYGVAGHMDNSACVEVRGECCGVTFMCLCLGIELRFHWAISPDPLLGLLYILSLVWLLGRCCTEEVEFLVQIKKRVDMIIVFLWISDYTCWEVKDM